MGKLKKLKDVYKKHLSIKIMNGRANNPNLRSHQKESLTKKDLNHHQKARMSQP